MRRGLASSLILAGLVYTACRQEDPNAPLAALKIVERGCRAKDVGLVMVSVDLHYQDDLGGPGRLEDDLRQLFTVYGRLLVKHQDLILRAEDVSGYAIVEGRGLRYEGPHRLEVKKSPDTVLIRSGLLTDLRGIIDTLRERRIAVESGMPKRLGRLISIDYRGEVGGKAELLTRLRKDLAAVEARAFIVDDVNIVVGGERARVIQSFLLITRARGKKLENRDRERIFLQKEGTRWRITGGLG